MSSLPMIKGGAGVPIPRGYFAQSGSGTWTQLQYDTWYTTGYNAMLFNGADVGTISIDNTGVCNICCIKEDGTITTAGSYRNTTIDLSGNSLIMIHSVAMPNASAKIKFQNV